MTDEITATESESERAPWTPDNDPDGYTFEGVLPKDSYLQTILTFYAGMSDKGEGGRSDAPAEGLYCKVNREQL